MLSRCISNRVEARFAGQILDSGEFGAVGHGVGMGIGAQMARPGKQVLVLMGNGDLPGFRCPGLWQIVIRIPFWGTKQ
jgi:thiamine pyrophosphate-dependent acetolactate synthase large subunit-like protein